MKKVLRILLGALSSPRSVTLYVCIIMAIFAFFFCLRSYNESTVLDQNFIILEALSILAALFISTYGYIHTDYINFESENNKEISPSQWDKMFALVNSAFFILAIYFILEPLILIFSTMMIYVLFSLNNFLVVRSYLKGVRSADKRDSKFCSKITEFKIFLIQENGLTAFGYFIVFCVMYFYLYPDNSKGNNPKDSEILHYQIAAFSGGIASFHLLLSTLSYVLRFLTPTSKILESAEWNSTMKSQLEIRNRDWIFSFIPLLLSFLVIYWIIQGSIQEKITFHYYDSLRETIKCIVHRTEDLQKCLVKIPAQS